MIPNHYETLGLNSSADKQTIKKAYRKLALEFHPDKNKSPDAHEKFIEINEAYLILYDEEARLRYDREYKFYFSKKAEQKTNYSGRSNYQQKSTSDEFREEGTYRRYEDEDLNKWSKNARDQAESFAKMAFNEFSNLIVGVVRETGFQLGNALIMALGAILTMSGCGNLIFGITSDIGNPILGIIFFPIGLFLWNLAQNNWDNHNV
ncbi:MAG: curved DNA-binding protein CbpA [Flavobacteriales bacterium]|jgi:curved DNA-binding protein CbpA